MQCKDIPTEPILEYIEAYCSQNWPRLCTWFINSGYPAAAVQYSMPDGITLPDKLVLAKMGKLIEKGLVAGCACGCYGNFQVTDKGRELLAASRERATCVSSAGTAVSPAISDEIRG